ncbi:hypothetical protein [Nocardia sp. NPDC051570]|uniref:hypothetical protein n=1 Tax=Nocardia sp. NPDC051570 TaxID=3364324 RepID=UPI00379D5D7B
MQVAREVLAAQGELAAQAELAVRVAQAVPGRARGRPPVPEAGDLRAEPVEQAVAG